MSETTPASTAHAVTLHCRPLKEGDALVFPYTLTNAGHADVYVMDAVPLLDEHGALKLDHDAVTVWAGSDGFAHVLKGIAPLPAGRSVAMRVIPLAAKLPAGATLERRLTLGVPLHETGPYHPDLPIRQYRQYRQQDIAGIVLSLHILAADQPGFGAVPGAAPELYRVAARDTEAQVATVSCRLPARSLHLLRRTDDFPRLD